MPVKVTITDRPSFAKARVELAPGESVKAESGAMLAMEGDVDIKTASGGIMKGLKRTFMGGESFFQNTFTAGTGGGAVHFCPNLPGDLWHTKLEGRTLVVQDGSYLFSSPEITVDTKWAGAKGFFSGEGFVMLKVSGHGDLVLSSYGAIDQHNLEPGQRFVVDTGHIVAFTDGLQHKIRAVGGIKSTILSGEGLVSEFQGPGTIWTQSRSTQSFISWLVSKMPSSG